MQANVGSVDRIIRIAAGVALALVVLLSGLPVFASAVWFWVGLAVAAILIVTALVGFCPAYRLLGVSTCPVRAR